MEGLREKPVPFRFSLEGSGVILSSLDRLSADTRNHLIGD
jgi:hypothetical protein